MYIPDDVSQIPDNHPGYIPAQEDRLKRLNLALHKRLDTVIDQEAAPTCRILRKTPCKPT
ncbi:hypothetical protein J3U01_07880 [Bifidobacterium sp. B4107]|uniref:hypothetical protein n=1 Tax=unclassified Bifidobacterium TaxID=2608897 RepID=UPI00226BA059|nr:MULTISPECIES: hypothetical protein [unclassified Bifidobacterium]MCX8648320.1 hypothetical protein [Bifidobacterium sp. B4107]MCX8652202.1 hypothetical protein [Bifidobacterium sp. B4111]MCX8658633.1 hypothetical protein [Bifidobacterium sp. B4114]